MPKEIMDLISDINATVRATREGIKIYHNSIKDLERTITNLEKMGTRLEKLYGYDFPI